jgi:hypothetical protein
LSARVSQDGMTWVALPTPVTVTAAGVVDPPINVAAYRFAALEVTIAGASVVIASVTSWGGSAT